MLILFSCKLLCMTKDSTISVTKYNKYVQERIRGQRDSGALGWDM